MGDLQVPERGTSSWLVAAYGGTMRKLNQIHTLVTSNASDLLVLKAGVQSDILVAHTRVSTVRTDILSDLETISYDVIAFG